MSHAELSETRPVEKTHHISQTPVVGTPLHHDEEKGVGIPYERKTSFNDDEKKLKRSSSSSHSQEQNVAKVLNAKEEADIEATRHRRAELYRKIRPFFLTALALVILGWWISATVLPATRHRWYFHH